MLQSVNIFKRSVRVFALLIISIFATCCEEVVDIPLETVAPRLVVDAAINWEKGTTGTTQKIVLTTTSDFYGTTIPPATGATVKVLNTSKNEFIFTEQGTTGVYICNNFEPKIGEEYVLEIIYKGENYSAVETMYSVSKISEITQKSDGGFLKDQYEVIFSFQDEANIANYNLARFQTNYLLIPTFYATDDRFSDGKLTNWNYSEKDLKPGNTLEFTNYGISKMYFNYMSILISIAGGSGGGGPFQTAPVSLRGNVINKTKTENYALGYFSISETEKIVYTVK